MPVKKSNKYDNSRFVDMGIVVTKRPKTADKPKKGKNNAKAK